MPGSRLGALTRRTRTRSSRRVAPLPSSRATSRPGHPTTTLSGGRLATTTILMRPRSDPGGRPEASCGEGPEQPRTVATCHLNFMGMKLLFFS